MNSLIFRNIALKADGPNLIAENDGTSFLDVKIKLVRQILRCIVYVAIENEREHITILINSKLINYAVIII